MRPRVIVIRRSCQYDIGYFLQWIDCCFTMDNSGTKELLGMVCHCVSHCSPLTVVIGELGSVTSACGVS